MPADVEQVVDECANCVRGVTPAMHTWVDVDVDRRVAIVRIIVFAVLDEPNDAIVGVTNREAVDLVVGEVSVELRLQVVTSPSFTHLVGRADRNECVTILASQGSDRYLSSSKSDAFVHGIDDSSTCIFVGGPERLGRVYVNSRSTLT